MGRHVLVSAIVMMALAGCSSNRDECVRDTDCSTGLVCSAGSCSSPATDGGARDAGAIDAGPNDDGGSSDAGNGTKCSDPSDYTTCTCDVKSDCSPLDPSKAKYFVCTPRKFCVKICFAKSDCATDEVCEDSECRPVACGDDAQCSSGQQCIGTTCRPAIQASEVASCEVLGSVVVKTGSTRDVSLLARDSSGEVIPYKGAVSWFANMPSIAIVSGVDRSAVVTGGIAAGTTSIGASIGGAVCSSVSATNLSALTSGQLRVVVIDQDSGKLLSGATVVLNSSTTQITNAQGTAMFTDPGAAATISVFEKSHAYVTVVETTTKDLFISVPPNPAPLTLHGSATPRAFDKLPDSKGTVHAALFAAAVQGNWMDFRAAAALGDPVPTEVDFGGSTRSEVEVLPGSVVGMNENMFRGSYDVIVPGAGTRTLWGLGGNLVLSDVLGIVSQISGGGDVDWGAISSVMGPVTDRHTSAVIRGAQVAAGQTLSLESRLGVLKRTRVTLNVPPMPSFKNYEGVTTLLDQIGVFAGAIDQWQGFVVLGSGNGVDKDKNGKVDAASMGGSEGQIALRLAPRHSGLETSKNAIVLIASPSGQIPTGSSNPSIPIAFSVLATLWPELDAPGPTSVSFGRSFVSIPNVVNLDQATRTLSFPFLQADVSFRRVDFGDSRDPKWYVYFPATTLKMTIPAVPASFEDRFASMRAGTSELSSAYLQSVSTHNLTFEEMLSFDGRDMDNMVMQTDGLSTREIVRASPIE